MSPSKIEWTNETWNPTTGCSKVSPGCANCYAETLTQRYSGTNGWPATFLPWTPANAAENVVLHPDRIEAPLHWKTPRRVFVNSMSDLFHEQIPDEFIDRVFAVMALTPQHTYQVLTKRPERMRAYCSDPTRPLRVLAAGHAFIDGYSATFAWPIANVWLGVTVENQRWADERIPILLDTPAAVRFLSCEPMLGPIDLTGRNCEHSLEWYGGACCTCGSEVHHDRGLDGFDHTVLDRTPLERLDWVICGGESGSGYRPFDPTWAFSLMKQCQEAKVAFFMKQMGGSRPGNKLEDLHPDLRVRQFPR